MRSGGRTWVWGRMHNVDPRLTVGTARRVPHVDNMDERQTAAAGQNWTGEAIKHGLSSLLSDLHFTTIKCYSIYITNVRSPPPFREKSVEASAQIVLIGRTVSSEAIDVWPNVASSSPSDTCWRARHHQRRPSFPWATKPRGTQKPRGNQLQGKKSAGERGIINAAPASLGQKNPEEHKNLGANSSK